MINLTVLTAFFNTSIYLWKSNGRSQEEVQVLKQKWAQMILSKLGYEITVFGTRPQDGPAILVGNHISYLDIPAVMSLLPEARFIAKDDIEAWPIVGLAATRGGTIFISRKTIRDKRLAKEKILKSLKEKNAKIVVFPSGTTTLNEEGLWKKGIFKIAKELGVPVKLFRLDYCPLRPSAYVENDNLIKQMADLKKHKNKRVFLTWLEQVDKIDDPVEVAHRLRTSVIVNKFQEL